MPTEIEAKMAVADHARIVEALKSAGATHHADIFEDNVFFDRPDRSMTEAGVGLRIRSEIHTSPDGSEKTVINMTYKGPKAAGPIKQREEIEFSLSTLDDAITLMQRIGFEVTIRFQKRRQRWRLDGCSIELDLLPHLGPYVEVEGPSLETVASVREKIGLLHHPTLTDSYASMLADHAKANELDLFDLTF